MPADDVLPPQVAAEEEERRLSPRSVITRPVGAAAQQQQQAIFGANPFAASAPGNAAGGGPLELLQPPGYAALGGSLSGAPVFGETDAMDWARAAYPAWAPVATPVAAPLDPMAAWYAQRLMQPAAARPGSGFQNPFAALAAQPLQPVPSWEHQLVAASSAGLPGGRPFPPLSGRQAGAPPFAALAQPSAPLGVSREMSVLSGPAPSFTLLSGGSHWWKDPVSTFGEPMAVVQQQAQQQQRQIRGSAMDQQASGGSGASGAQGDGEEAEDARKASPPRRALALLPARLQDPFRLNLQTMSGLLQPMSLSGPMMSGGLQQLQGRSLSRSQWLFPSSSQLLNTETAPLLTPGGTGSQGRRAGKRGSSVLHGTAGLAAAAGLELEGGGDSTEALQQQQQHHRHHHHQQMAQQPAAKRRRQTAPPAEVRNTGTFTPPASSSPDDGSPFPLQLNGSDGLNHAAEVLIHLGSSKPAN